MTQPQKLHKVSGNTKPLTCTFKRSRNYCFTDFEILEWETIYNDNIDIIRYICVGQEFCPKTEKLHLQGWIQFHNPKSLRQVKKIAQSNKLHIEACRGSEKTNDKYCKKDGKYKSWGTFKSQGQRTDLEACKLLIDQGKKLYEIAQNYFPTFVRYFKGLERYKTYKEEEERGEWRNVEVIVLSGKTGSGKTKAAMMNASYKIEGSSLDWWDGYNGETSICIDEYDNDVKITKLLNLLDGYKLRLPIKGGFTYANWNKVYITTNLTEEQLHPQAKQEHRKALDRRITHWIDTNEWVC